MKNNSEIFNLSINNNDKYFLKKRKSINLDKKFDNNQDYSKIIIKKPWGYEYLIYQNSKVAITILYIKKGHMTSMHCHPNKKTSLLVLDGKILLKTLNQNFELNYGKCAVIDKKKFHQSYAKYNDVILMEVETPNNKNDLVRLKDSYGRSNLGYESISNMKNVKENFNYILNESENTYHNKIKKFANLSIGFFDYLSLKSILIKKTISNIEKITILRGSIKINEINYSVGDTLLLKKLISSSKKVKIEENLLSVITQKNNIKSKVSDLVIDFLVFKNFKNFFSTIGNNNLHLLDSLGKKEETNLRLFNNSLTASLAALGHSKASNNAAVLILSSGQSAVKSIQSIVSSYIDSEPLIIICGYSRYGKSTYTKNVIQDKFLNVSELIKKFTNFSYKITKDNEIFPILNKAISLSISKRNGPVWIDIPIDLLGKLTNNKSYYQNLQKQKKLINQNNKNNIAKYSKIFNLLINSRKPVFLFGYGSSKSNLKNNIKILQKKYKIPYLFSRRAIDLLETNSELNFGRPGVIGNRYSNFILQNSDLIIGIGTKFSTEITGKDLNLFAPKAKKVCINIDKKVQGNRKNFYNIFLNDQCEGFIDYLIKSKTKIPSFNKWLNESKLIKNKFSFKFENYKNTSKISPYKFINLLSKKIPDKSVIFYDGGLITNYIIQGFKVKKNQKIITNSGMDEGFALSSSLGYFDNKKYKKLICICDDTNILDLISDFHIFSSLQTSSIIICITGTQNNSIRQIQKQFFGERFIGTKSTKGEIIDRSGSNKFLNIRNLVKQMKLNFYEISKPGNLSKDLSNIFKMKKSTFCLVNIDKEHLIKPKMGFNIDFNGNWIQRPLEDMYPFIQQKLINKYIKK